MSHQQETAAQAFVARHAVGDVLDGHVVSVVGFGAFVEVAEEVHGLLPISEWNEQPALGIPVQVRILGIDANSGRFSLQPA